MMVGQWIEIFRAGDYGKKGKFAESDLDQIVGNFNTKDGVPIVVGHPTTDSPAWGWLSAVKREGSSLLARVANLNEKFSQALTEKRFKNRSVKVIKTDKGWKLAHLGFLGAELPGVEGMTPISMADDGEPTIIEFHITDDSTPEEETMPAKDGNKKQALQLSDPERSSLQKQLHEMEQRLKDADERAAKAEAAKQAADDERRRSEFSAWYSEQVKAGHISAAKKAETIAFMMALPYGNEATFAWRDGDSELKAGPVTWLKSFIEGLPQAQFAQALPQGPDQQTDTADGDYSKMTANM